MAWRVLRTLYSHPKDDAFLGFYDVITQPDAELYTFDLDWTLHLRSAYEVGREQGMLDQTAVAELAEIDAFWRAHPQAFDAAFGDLIPRIDPARELAGWVEDETGAPMPIPASHWWWRLSKDW
ncbi:hypothetical protein EDC62_0212 [Tibeticola sediminis]|uniref:Uncharacterized protein n=1 Tax=Tibeticola sediminis TaxID=1917811 RepID=A0A3N4UY31_9BURK|nr:hypothetical protein [Tibeticola sediminis]RPE72521.1 hypothetical protein EDC62_0212 [Tibeticola sediminis]